MQALEEAPSSGNFWSRVPSPSNLQSSQSSVLEGLGSASLPIDQLQLKAGSFPRLSAPQSTSALSAPHFWGSASVDSNIQLPAGAVGIQAGSYGFQGSPQVPQGPSLQMPWLTSWSQGGPITVAEPVCKDVSVSEPSLKRGRDRRESIAEQKDNGEPVDSKPSKRLAGQRPQPAQATQLEGSSIEMQPNNSVDKMANVDAEAGKQIAGDGPDTGSPNTSSHSSSPETGAVGALDPTQG